MMKGLYGVNNVGHVPNHQSGLVNLFLEVNGIGHTHIPVGGLMLTFAIWQDTLMNQLKNQLQEWGHLTF